MHKIMIISTTGLPNNAPSLRLFNYTYLLKDTMKILYYCNVNIDNSITTVSNLNNFNDYTCLYKNYQYVFISKNFKYRMVNILELFTGYYFKKKIKKYIELENPDYILLYNPLCHILKYIYKLCKQKKITLIIDCTEWYEYYKNDHFISKFYAKSVDKRIRKFDLKVDGIIVISSYLEDYYDRINVNKFKLPPITKSVVKKNSLKINKKICTYAGSPAKKDIIEPMIDAFIDFNLKKINIELHFIGLTEKDLKSQRYIHLSKFGIYFHGKKSHDEVIKLLNNTTFSFLFREKKRYALAGHSTKMAECLSNGVPIIFNNVGGEEKILEEKKCGWMIEKVNKKNIIDILHVINKLSDKEILNYKYNCINTANKIYAYQNYSQDFINFLTEIKSKH